MKFALVVASVTARRFVNRLSNSYARTFVSTEEVGYDLHKDQGFFHFQTGDYIKARDEFFQYLNHVEDRDPGILYMLAMCYKNMNDYREETDFLRQAEMSAKNDPDIIRALGESLYNIEEYPQAVIFLEKARKRAPGDASIYYRLGVCHEKMQDSKRAEIFYTKAIALDPLRVEYQQTLGFLYKAEDRHKEAIACLRRALHVEYRSCLHR